MQPLSDDDDKQAAFDDTMHVSVSGTVTASDQRTCTFHIHGSQFVCGQHENIAVRAHMNKNPKWKNPAAVLPRTKSVISFHGILDRFESITPPNKTERIKCVVVAVQQVTFLQGPQEETTSPLQTPAQKSVRDRVKRRREKKVKADVEASPATACNSQDTSSQVVLGKRVASPSDDDDESSKIF